MSLRLLVLVSDLPIPAASGDNLGPIAYWDSWFESRRGHERLSLVSIVCYAEVCDGPIPRPEESYRLWCVMRVTELGCCARGEEFMQVVNKFITCHRSIKKSCS
jgi:hypothetical protein